MKPEKTDRSVSNMDVLKDIRGLLSVTRERDNITVDGVSGKSVLEDEITRLKAQIKDYKALVQKQREELHRIASEKAEFTVKSKGSGSGNEKLTSQVSESTILSEEAAQLKSRIAELSLALSQIEDLLKLKAQELLQKIARLFQEAGQGEVTIELRKAASELETVENFAHFLRVLLEQ